jgi:hypothetical protein
MFVALVGSKKGETTDGYRNSVAGSQGISYDG